MEWLGKHYNSTDLHGQLLVELEDFHNLPSSLRLPDSFTRGQIYLADQIHQFVDSVTNSVEPGFVETKGVFENVVPKWVATELGVNFYSLVHGSMGIYTPRLRYSPEVEQFHETCFNLGLHQFIWPNDPEASALWITPTAGLSKFRGQTQGAVVYNELVQKLRRDLHSPRYKERVKRRENPIKAVFRSLMEYEAALFGNVKTLQAVSIDLAYRFPDGQQVTLRQAQSHIARLVSGSPKSIFADQCGFVRQLQYWHSSYRFRVIFFFRNENTTHMDRIEKIGQHWTKSITDGVGTYLGAQFRDISTASPTMFTNHELKYDRAKVQRSLGNLCLFENFLEAALERPGADDEASDTRLKTITRGEMPKEKSSGNRH